MTHDCPECPETLDTFHELHDHVNDEHDLVDRALKHGAADGAGGLEISLGPLQLTVRRTSGGESA